MKSNFQVQQKDGSLIVEFVSDPKRLTHVPLEMVLDFNQQGEVTGIEIINLALKAGKNTLQVINRTVRTDGDGVRYAYDEDADCFYLRLKADNSADQKAVQGALFLDDDGQITRLSAEWKSKNTLSL